MFPGKEVDSYIVNLLKQALSYSPEKNYQLAFYNKNLPKLRVFQSIATNDGIDVIAAGASIDRDKILRPIRFPIMKGLFGWRVPLVNNNNSDLFAQTLSPSTFKKLKIGQLFSWSDTKILESNNLPVEKGSHYQGLFYMLDANRFDYFPLSVMEVHDEFDNYKTLNISIDEHILIYYPTAYLFYVNKDNKTLANDINYGLEQSLKDGSFEQLFMQYYGKIINQTILEKRKVYKLKNPLLPQKTPLHRKELWLNLSTEEIIL